MTARCKNCYHLLEECEPQKEKELVWGHYFYQRIIVEKEGAQVLESWNKLNCTCGCTKPELYEGEDKK